MIVAALDSVPASAANSGVRTLQQLTNRFKAVQGAALRAAYTPEGSGMMGHAIASITTFLLFTPKAQDSKRFPLFPVPATASTVWLIASSFRGFSAW